MMNSFMIRGQGKLTATFWAARQHEEKVFRVKEAHVTPVEEGKGGFSQLIFLVFQMGKCAV